PGSEAIDCFLKPLTAMASQFRQGESRERTRDSVSKPAVQITIGKCLEHKVAAVRKMGGRVPAWQPLINFGEFNKAMDEVAEGGASPGIQASQEICTDAA